MPKTVLKKKQFTFVKGLNTEGGYLTFPENFWYDGDNMTPLVDGSVEPRKRIDFEDSYVYSSNTYTDSQKENLAFVCGEWTAVAGNGSRNFIVVQCGILIEFYLNFGATVSSTRKSFTIDLTSHKVANPNTAGVAPISCISANGKLIIVSQDTEPLLVTYDENTDTISVAEITIQIRDFQGLNDGLDVDERPASITDSHRYNLYNQGWDATKVTAYQADASSSSLYPSNAQVWILGKNSSDDFTPSILNKQDFGTTPAPRGRYILDAFYRDRATVSGIAGLAVETESYRPTTAAFYAGRAWYAGIRSSGIGSWVMFSQVADSSDKFGKCYQDADPTSEHVSDLIATDGGVIPILEVGTIVKLVPVGQNLLVFADNGIWQISGGDTTGFVADSYIVAKISSFGCVSAQAVVEVENTLAFWSNSGIYTFNIDPQSLNLTPQGMTDNVLTDLYANISSAAKAMASGKYYQEAKKVIWLYDSTPDVSGVTNRFIKDKALIYDLRLGAWYTYTFSDLASNSPHIYDLIVTRGRDDADNLLTVIDNSANEVVVGSDTVVASLAAVSNLNRTVKFLTLHPTSTNVNKVTFSDLDTVANAPAKFKDWYTVNSVGAAYTYSITTGFDYGGEGDKKFQPQYITVFMKRTETGFDGSYNAINESSCTMQSRWDWTDTATPNRWDAGQQVYRHVRPWIPSSTANFDNGYPVVVTKNKIRGRGKAMQLKFTGESGKDMKILGWATTYLGNANV